MLFIFILFLGGVFALCEDGQIDINSASLEELDNLYGIGPVKAEAIINSRPFQSIDELIDVSGIGEFTLTKIKEQGLACVEEETLEETQEPIEETSEEPNEAEEEIAEDTTNQENPKDSDSPNYPTEELSDSYQTPIEPNIIKLNSALHEFNS